MSNLPRLHSEAWTDLVESDMPLCVQEPEDYPFSEN